jgi:hypothetical protein
VGKKIAGAVIEEREGGRRLRLWVLLPKRRRRKATDRTAVLLAIAVLGLAVLLMLRHDPDAAKLLIRLLAALVP